MTPYKTSRQAFNLVELLVALSIIMMLAAIILPVFSAIREVSQRTTCQGNLKQIGGAIQLYTQDYDELFPSIGRFSSTFEHFPTNTYSDAWSLSLPYLKSEAIFRCPSDTPQDCVPEYGCMKDGKEISYAFNGGPTFPGFDQRMGGIYASRPAMGPRGAALASVTKPSEAFLAADGWDVAWHFMAPEAYAFSAIPGNNSSWRHRGYRNCLFIDGHVKALRFRAGKTAAANAVLLPRDETYYASYCINPDAEIDHNGPKRCGDVVKLIEPTIKDWTPD